MPHMLTATGAEYHFAGLAALMPGGRPVRILDIAHQLAMINRFHGATTRPYSVAEHSLLVSEIAQRNGLSMIVQLAALLHDGHEIYTQDLASPAKRAVDHVSAQAGGSAAWQHFEADHAQNLRRHFGLTTVFASTRAALRRMDLEALATERRDLVPFDRYLHQPWPVLGDGHPDPARVIEPLEWVSLRTPEREAKTWRDWRDAFAARFDEISIGLGRDLREGVPA